jgi:hypothetical protein
MAAIIDLRYATSDVKKRSRRPSFKETIMNRLLVGTAVAVVLGLAPALATEDSAPPTQSGVTPEASTEAKMPPSGAADESGGAAEQSSAAPKSKAAEAQPSNEGASSDQSGGAKEQSSAPPDSSASSSDKPNPTVGAEGESKY